MGNPDLAKVVDSGGRTALHFAASEGHREIVEVLLKANKDACLKADEGGRIPLHLAAMRGQVEVMEELINEKPESILKKMHGYTVLHLCVRYNHLNALKLLLKSTYIDDKFINSNDPNNETILLTSARLKQIEIECYLVSHPRISVDSKSLAKAFGFGNPPNDDQYEKLRGNLMVVASLIAQMSFQVATNPPGGFWQVNTKKFDEGCPEGSGMCKAGTSVLAYTSKSDYHLFTACNTLSFVASLSVILLLISQVPLQNKFFVGILIIGMWSSITLIAATYIFSMRMVQMQADDEIFSRVFSLAPIFLAWLIFSLVSYHIFQFGIWLIFHKSYVIAKSGEILDSLVKKIKNLKSNVVNTLKNSKSNVVNTLKNSKSNVVNKLKNLKPHVCRQVQRPTGTVV
ncbi:ankyrin repeat-containing protein NPR4-like [Pistacia vera]|uniref:ankyrin repeat-containing protein NPR4-like n=1 Tax=Pistacia vera TaxID=55513 RepID=UPI001263987C|nr:ankyrin repeat-containing protein NPR4-like [Pistacia vera]